MKKVVSLLLAVVMVLGLGVTVLAADSPTSSETSETTTSAKPVTTKGLELYNSDDELYAIVPANEVRKISVGNANKLDDEDKEAFLAAYEDVKNIDGKIVKYFYWLDIPEQYKTDEFAYAKYIFTCTGNNVEVQVNGKDMEVEQIGRFTYWAKLTEFGAVAILCD